MKIEIYTDFGQALIDKIFKYVEDDSAKTWEIREGKKNRYLTHKPDQWYDKALFKFNNEKEKVIIELTWWKDKEPTEYIKGCYMGRLTELLLNNFSDKFGKFEIIK
ncbi:MAG: hypothetical protein WC135_02245 [Bacteroidales bacterium]